MARASLTCRPRQPLGRHASTKRVSKLDHVLYGRVGVGQEVLR